MMGHTKANGILIVCLRHPRQDPSSDHLEYLIRQGLSSTLCASNMPLKTRTRLLPHLPMQPMANHCLTAMPLRYLERLLKRLASSASVSSRRYFGIYVLSYLTNYVFRASRSNHMILLPLQLLK